MIYRLGYYMSCCFIDIDCLKLINNRVNQIFVSYLVVIIGSFVLLKLLFAFFLKMYFSSYLCNFVPFLC